ncbi:MAG: hypothetical protein J6W35_05750 [Eubacterium sp.]|nr:hypothetical protein [Eubacterium sp.]
MKNKIILIAITIVSVFAMGLVMSGCSCGGKDDETTFNPANVSGESASHMGNGNNVVNDNFGTISPTEKATDKNGDTVISYTDAEGNKVFRTIKKNGTIKIVVKNKKGKVIRKHTYKPKKYSTPTNANNNNKKKDNKKKDDKKKDDQEHGVVANDGDGWSDFY